MSQIKGTVEIALDSVEWGNGENCGRHDKKIKVLPNGITNKRLYSDVIRIGWPALLEYMLTQLAGMFDQMQVGKVGSFAISAVGVANQPKFLLNTAFMSMNVGVTAMVARARGKGNQEEANKMMRQGVLFTLISSILVAIAGYIWAPLLVSMMGSDDPATVNAAIDYLRVLMFSMVPFALTSTITAALRAVGDSRTAFIYNTLGNVVNIFLNWVLITGHLGAPALGVRGAAIATAISQVFSFVLACFAVMKDKMSYLYLSLRQDYTPDKIALANIIKIGLPAMAEQLILRAGVVLYSRTITALGTVAYATHSICMNIQSLSFMNGMGWAASATALVGQSLGKKRYDMAMIYSKCCQVMGFIVAAAIGVSFIFFGKNIAGLYTEDPEIINMCGFILLLIAVLQPFSSSQQVLAGAMRGAGDTKFVAYVTALTMFGMRPLIAWVLINYFNLGLPGAWYALVIDQATRTLLVFMRYNSGKWKDTFKEKV